MKISLYAGPPLQEALRGFDGNRSGRVTGIAERYLEVCRRHRPELSAEEWNTIRNILSSTVRDVTLARMLEIEIEDACRFAEWGIDGAALVARIKGMTFAERIAILEDADRWWADRSGEQSQRSPG